MTHTYQATRKTAQEYAQAMQRGIARRSRRNSLCQLYVFQSRKLRDAVYAHLYRLGINTKRECVRNQLLHPEYVDDYEGEVTTGFGNTQYETHFAVLYKLSLVEQGDKCTCGSVANHESWCPAGQWNT